MFFFLGPARHVPTCGSSDAALQFQPVAEFPQKFPTPPALGFSPPRGGTGSFHHPIRLGAVPAASQAPVPAHSQHSTKGLPAKPGCVLLG